MPGITCVLECYVSCHIHFVDPGQYISPPSFEPACEQKRLSGVEGDCLVSRAVALTSKRVTSFSSPQSLDKCCPMLRVVTSTGARVADL